MQLFGQAKARTRLGKQNALAPGSGRYEQRRWAAAFFEVSYFKGGKSGGQLCP